MILGLAPAAKRAANEDASKRDDSIETVDFLTVLAANVATVQFARHPK